MANKINNLKDLFKQWEAPSDYSLWLNDTLRSLPKIGYNHHQIAGILAIMYDAKDDNGMRTLSEAFENNVEIPKDYKEINSVCTLRDFLLTSAMLADNIKKEKNSGNKPLFSPLFTVSISCGGEEYRGDIARFYAKAVNYDQTHTHHKHYM